MKNHMNEEICPITLIPLSKLVSFDGKSVTGSEQTQRDLTPSDPIKDYESYRQGLLNRGDSHTIDENISHEQFLNEMCKMKRLRVRLSPDSLVAVIPDKVLINVKGELLCYWGQYRVTTEKMKIALAPTVNFYSDWSVAGFLMTSSQNITRTLERLKSYEN